MLIKTIQITPHIAAQGSAAEIDAMRKIPPIAAVVQAIRAAEKAAKGVTQ